ncbi:MAG: hypothetical protein K2X74_04160 [Acetobacteraceae bacterium]|nr:hypothetical protein [Acetobacteraceae bacterium]
MDTVIITAAAEVGLLFAPVAPRLRRLAGEIGRLADGGGGYSAQAAIDLMDELTELATGAALEEAIACTDERVSRAVFAIAGAVARHGETGFWLGAEDAVALRRALLFWAAALERLPRLHAPREDAA